MSLLFEYLKCKIIWKRNDVKDNVSNIMKDKKCIFFAFFLFLLLAFHLSFTSLFSFKRYFLNFLNLDIFYDVDKANVVDIFLLTNICFGED